MDDFQIGLISLHNSVYDICHAYSELFVINLFSNISFDRVHHNMFMAKLHNCMLNEEITEVNDYVYVLMSL